MANTKKYVSLDKLELYDGKIKKVITDGDAAALASAKEYADKLATNYDAAGSAAGVQAKLDEEVIRAKAAEEAAAAAAAAAQSDVDALETYVGTLPSGSAATSVVDYINIKTSGIATDTALSELNNQVSGLQGVVNGITADYLKQADKDELSGLITAEAARADKAEKANAAAIKEIADDYLKAADMETLQGNIDAVAEDVAEIVEDYLKAADKTELQDAIDLKADQTALDAEIERATGIEGGFETRIKAIEDDHLVAADKTELQGAINTLTGVVETLRDGIDAEKVDGVKDLISYVEEHGGEVTGMKEDIAGNAEAISGLEGRIVDLEGDMEEVQGAVATKVEQTAYDVKVKALEDADSAMAGRLDTLEAIDHEAYVAADAALKSELEGKINAKADSSALTSAVEALEAADEGIIERVAALEGKFGEGEGSVEDMIADAKAEAIEAAASAADTKDEAVLAAAKKYADDEDALIEQSISALQAVVDGKAASADLTALAGRVTTAEGEIDTLQSEMDAVEALAAANKLAHEANAAALLLKASQADLEAVSGRVTAIEDWHKNFVEVSEEEINGLFD